MNFIAIDVETANRTRAICQIGIAKYIDGILVEEWVSLINPEDHFDSINVQIHGIDENKVADAPIFSAVLERLKYFMDGSVCVSHSGFDSDAIAKAFQKYSIQPLNITWLDSMVAAQVTWPSYELGYKLNNLCKKIGYEFKHHNALEDAKAAGEVLLAAIKESGLDLDTWLKRISQSSSATQRSVNSVGWTHHSSIKREGNPEGGLYGEVILFTGELSQMEKEDASKLAAELGCRVATNISKKITLLVVGYAQNKTTKHREAEQLIAKGHNIRILNEGEFFELIEHIGFPPARE